jgi:hypothetical protein
MSKFFYTMCSALCMIASCIMPMDLPPKEVLLTKSMKDKKKRETEVGAHREVALLDNNNLFIQGTARSFLINLKEDRERSVLIMLQNTPKGQNNFRYYLYILQTLFATYMTLYPSNGLAVLTDKKRVAIYAMNMGAQGTWGLVYQKLKKRGSYFQAATLAEDAECLVTHHKKITLGITGPGKKFVSKAYFWQNSLSQNARDQLQQKRKKKASQSIVFLRGIDPETRSVTSPNGEFVAYLDALECRVFKKEDTSEAVVSLLGDPDVQLSTLFYTNSILSMVVYKRHNHTVEVAFYSIGGQQYPLFTKNLVRNIPNIPKRSNKYRIGFSADGSECALLCEDEVHAFSLPPHLWREHSGFRVIVEQKFLVSQLLGLPKDLLRSIGEFLWRVACQSL